MNTTNKTNKTEKSEMNKKMSKSVIKHADQNKTGIQKLVTDTAKSLQKATRIHSIARFLEHKEDKERVAEILENIKEAQKVLSDLTHIVVHDEYWAKLRRRI